MQKAKLKHKKISAFYYIKNNRKRTAVLVISLGLFITMLYGLAFLLSTTTASGYSSKVVLTKKMQFIIPDSEMVDFDRTAFSQKNNSEQDRHDIYFDGLNKLIDKYKAVTDIDYAFPCSILQPSLTMLIGQMRLDTIVVKADAVPVIMDYLGATLKEGHIPAKPGEIIIDDKIAKNMKIGIGDNIFSKDFTVSGIAECKTYFACGAENDELINPGVVLLSDGRNKDFTKLSKDLGYPPEKIWVSDYISGKEYYRINFMDAIQLSINLITILSSIMLSICIVVVFNMYIRDRHEEWCLYHSVGFSTREVYLLACRELLISIALGIGFAVILSTAAVVAFTTLMIKPLGLISTPFMPGVLLQIACILTMLFGILQMPLTYAMNRIKTVDAMEEEFI